MDVKIGDIPGASDWNAGDQSEAEITAWLVSDGDQVTVGQAIFELGLDKADVEILSPAEGRINILVNERAVVDRNAVVATIDTE